MHPSGLHRTGYDLDLRQYGDGHWRASFYVTGLAYSILGGSNKGDPVLLAIESYLGGCIGAVQAAFFNVERSLPEFKAIDKRWRSALDPGDREFLNYMMDERGHDVHYGVPRFIKI